MVLIDWPTRPIEPGSAIETFQGFHPKAARDICAERRDRHRQRRSMHGHGRNANARYTDDQCRSCSL